MAKDRGKEQDAEPQGQKPALIDCNTAIQVIGVGLLDRRYVKRKYSDDLKSIDDWVSVLSKEPISIQNK